jgi:transposase InsO family protein
MVPTSGIGFAAWESRRFSWHRARRGNPFVERLIGSIRRECLDPVLVINGAHLLRVLREYFAYYHESRPHQSLEGNAPRPREIEPPRQGRIVAEPQVGGLHHRYRRAA